MEPEPEWVPIPSEMAVSATTLDGLPYVSCDATKTEKFVAAVVEPGVPVMTSLLAAAGLTVNEFETPVSLLAVLVAVIVVAAPDCVSVTAVLASTPELNAALVTQPALHVRFEVRSTVPVNPVTVLLPASRAVTLTLKLEPADCVAMLPPPPAFSTRKF